MFGSHPRPGSPLSHQFITKYQTREGTGVSVLYRLESGRKGEVENKIRHLILVQTFFRAREELHLCHVCFPEDLKRLHYQTFVALVKKRFQGQRETTSGWHECFLANLQLSHYQTFLALITNVFRASEEVFWVVISVRPLPGA